MSLLPKKSLLDIFPAMKKSLPHDAYNELADAYAAAVDTKPHKACDERPAHFSATGM